MSTFTPTMSLKKVDDIFITCYLLFVVLKRVQCEINNNQHSDKNSDKINHIFNLTSVLFLKILILNA